MLRFSMFSVNTLKLISPIESIQQGSRSVLYLDPVTSLEMSPVQGKSPPVHVKEPYGNLDIVTCSRSVYYYVFCVFSTLFSFIIRSTDHYCKTTHRAKSRFSINFYPFWFVSRRFFLCLREVISSLIQNCVYQLVNYREQTSQLVMLCEQVSANQPQNW